MSTRILFIAFPFWISDKGIHLDPGIDEIEYSDLVRTSINTILVFFSISIFFNSLIEISLISGDLMSFR